MGLWTKIDQLLCNYIDRIGMMCVTTCSPHGASTWQYLWSAHYYNTITNNRMNLSSLSFLLVSHDRQLMYNTNTRERERERKREREMGVVCTSTAVVGVIVGVADGIV